MQNTHTLTRHRDIQNWVNDRHGTPAIRRQPNTMGEIRSRLAIRFTRSPAPEGAPSIDDGIMPVSWSAWLAELDRQQLAVRVNESEFEFVERKELN